MILTNDPDNSHDPGAGHARRADVPAGRRCGWRTGDERRTATSSPPTVGYGSGPYGYLGSSSDRSTTAAIAGTEDDGLYQDLRDRDDELPVRRAGRHLQGRPALRGDRQRRRRPRSSEHRGRVVLPGSTSSPPAADGRSPIVHRDRHRRPSTSPSPPRGKAIINASSYGPAGGRARDVGHQPCPVAVPARSATPAPRMGRPSRSRRCAIARRQTAESMHIAHHVRDAGLAA